MQIKNAAKHHQQFYFRKEAKDKNQPGTVELLHIPAGATVEIEDSLYKKLLTGTTTVNEQRVEEVKLDESAVGAEIKNGKEIYTVKEFYDTGVVKEINLFAHSIKEGKLVVVTGVAVTAEEVAKFLNAEGISVKDIDEAQQLALYNRLNGLA